MSKQLFNNRNGRGGNMVHISFVDLYNIVHDRIENMCMGEQSIDPNAVCQDVCVEIEKKMGTFPNIPKMKETR